MPAAEHAVADAKAIFEAAVRGVQADRLISGVDWTACAPWALDDYQQVFVVGMGKAAMAMAGAVEVALGKVGAKGVVVVPEGYPETLPPHLSPPRAIEVIEGGHPVPTAASQRAARQILDLAAQAGNQDLVLVLISGGGSALAADFAGAITLSDAQATFRLLLESGADIHAINAVRKHLSRIGGGRLARAAAPADVSALVVSDVVGDDLATIASGPTVPDPSTFEDAVEVLQGFDLWEKVSPSVQKHLKAGQLGAQPETLKPGDPVFERVWTQLIGTNRVALEAARAEAEQRGYDVHVMATDVTGEARTVGRQHAERVLHLTTERPTCLLWGGETTVTVRGSGTGGRNQELALAAAQVLDGADRSITVLSGGTDGIDGPTDAAGAWATPETVARAREKGLDPQAYLDDNNAYPFFDQLGALLKPGPTHTNVMDVQVALMRS